MSTAAATAQPASTTTSTSTSAAPADATYLSAALAKLFDSALGATARALPYDAFAACFPTPAARQPRLLRGVWEQVVAKLEAKSRAEFDAILAERGAVRGLDELGRLVGEARGRRERGVEREEGEEGDEEVEVVAPHTLPPETLLAAHLQSQLAPVRDKLTRQLDDSRGRNAALADEVAAQRKEMEALVGALERAIRDLEQAGEVLDEVVEGEDVRGEGRRLVAREVEEAGGKA